MNRRGNTKFKKDQFELKRKIQCPYCGIFLTKLTATVDHIKPLSKGGENKEYNMQLVCESCNKMKGNNEFPTIKVDNIEVNLY